MFAANQNRALNFITSSYSQHPCVGHLVKVLPDLTKSLYVDAEKTAAEMMADLKEEIPTGRRRLLTECILDLELVSSFDEVVKYTKEFALASCYVDAVLFQATGKEASGYPTDMQYRVEGTHTCRGIPKYRKAKEQFNVPDPMAWLFGKEFGAIVFENAIDFSHIVAVNPLTVLIRAHGTWRTRYVLTNEVPTQEELSRVSAVVNKAVAERDRLFEKLRESAPEE